jgi:hypothetical protein
MTARTYAVLLEVPHSGGNAWHWAAAEFDERLADQVIPPVLSADLVAEVRRGRYGLRLRIAVTVRAADVADAVTAAWAVLEAASDVGGFDLASATAEARPSQLALSSHYAPAGYGLVRRATRSDNGVGNDIIVSKKGAASVKKVRYAAGAIGALGMLPATGLAAQAANAVTTHPSATTGKSVRLVTRAAPRLTCLSKNKHTSSYYIRGYIAYSTSNDCVGFVEVHRYHGDPTGEEARIRWYSPNIHGTYTIQSFLPGTIDGGGGKSSILFSTSRTFVGVSKVCEEIVSEKNHKSISYINPVCQTT